jgi:endonuclease YncB( thermonuclease family)
MKPLALALSLAVLPLPATAAPLHRALPTHFLAPGATLHHSLPTHLPAPGATHVRVPGATSRARSQTGAPHRIARRPPAWSTGARRAASLAGAPRGETVMPERIHVHDGDTFYVGGETIRLRGIDTPELGQPRAAEATRRLIALLHSGPVTIVRRAEDVYGRIVADVYVGGRDVARMLRAEGYAKPHARSA